MMFVSGRLFISVPVVLGEAPFSLWGKCGTLHNTVHGATVTIVLAAGWVKLAVKVIVKFFDFGFRYSREHMIRVSGDVGS